MKRTRMEAFSDGVLAIVITIMVLELKVPHEPELKALLALGPVFISYVLSFIYVAIYWNNHHHLLHTVERVDGRILWANMHLLFWLSMTPFATAWMGENHFAPIPTAIYGGVLLAAAIAYYLLQLAINASHGPASRLRQMLGDDWKGKLSPLVYLVAIPVALVQPLISLGLYGVVALVWLVPDSRIERAIKEE